MSCLAEPGTASCWILSDGKAGTETQAHGLAAALGLKPVIKRPRLRTPWRQLGPTFRAWAKHGLTPQAADSGQGLPSPDITISAGRTGAMAALAVRAQAATAPPFAIHIQDPRIAPHNFDLVIAPEHDCLRGHNVFATLGGLHSVTLEALAGARTRWAPTFSALPTPRVAVLIGGRSRAYDLPEDTAAALATALGTLTERHGASVMATLSRRTPAAAATRLADGIEAAGGWLWDGRGENPYLGLLAWADHIVLTSDSVTMASEAAVTGCPLHLYPLPGGNAKFDRFHTGLRRAGIARPFDAALPAWSYPPLMEPRRIADLIAPELRCRGLQISIPIMHRDGTMNALSPETAAPHSTEYTERQ